MNAPLKFHLLNCHCHCKALLVKQNWNLNLKNTIANQLIEQPMQHLCAKQKAKRLRPMNVCALLSLQPLCNVQHDSMCDLCSMYRATPSLQPAVGARTVDCGLWTLIPLGAQLKTARSIQPASQSATHADPSRKASSTCDVASSRLQH